MSIDDQVIEFVIKWGPTTKQSTEFFIELRALLEAYGKEIRRDGQSE